jgi:RimJ/RimL family protein N-acetyltransferase
MQSVERLSTDRLLGDRISAEHLDELQRMHRDPAVMTTLGGVRSEEETREFLRESLEHWERYGYGLWFFTDRMTGLFVGRAGFRHLEVGGGEEVELAYALRAEAWGQGFATEMAREILNVGFEQLGLASVVAFTLPTNVASRRVMEKSGFELERDIIHADLPHVLYRIRASDRSKPPA